MSKSKTPEQVVKDISTRLLPQYAVALDSATQRRANDLVELQVRGEYATKLDALGFRPSGRGITTLEEFHMFRQEGGYANVRVGTMSQGGNVTLDLKSVPPDKALKILAVLMQD